MHVRMVMEMHVSHWVCCIVRLSLFLSFSLNAVRSTPSKTVKGMGSLERSRAKAARFWEKACDVKHDRACHMISEMYHYGVGVEKNQSLAERMRKTSCDRGHADCCHALGVAYLTSTGKDRDASKALEPLSRACERGHGGACHNLAVMYRKGDGVKKSDTLFEKFARLAETLNSQTVRRS